MILSIVNFQYRDECIICNLMSSHIESYPLISHLEKQSEFFTAGVFVCIINLDLLPQYLIDYLESPDSFDFDPDTLNHYLDQVRVWIIKEKKQKPNEFGSVAIGLETPPQETRKPNEYLITTLTAALIEECLPADQLNLTDLKTSFAYCQGASYLGHATYQSSDEEKTLMDKYRADYFLVGFSGLPHSLQLHDSEVEPIGWITIAEYLSDLYPSRRLGGKAIVEQSRKHLLHFLETYWKNPTAHQLSLTEAIANMDTRSQAPDFNKRKFPPTVVAANASSPAF